MRCSVPVLMSLTVATWFAPAIADEGDADVRQCLQKIADPNADVRRWLDHLDSLALPAEQGARVYARLLRDTRPIVRAQAVKALSQYGPKAAAALPDLCKFLDECDGETNQYVIAAHLDAVRAIGPATDTARDTIAALLSERAVIYRDRDRVDVVRLRAYILVVLSETGVGPSAIPRVIDSLANIDERMLACEAGAAARAAGSLGLHARTLVPYLLSALKRDYYDPEFSLQRFDPNYPVEEATTVQIEVLRALTRIQPPNDDETRQAVARVLRDSDPKSRHHRQLVIEADNAIAAMKQETKDETPPATTSTVWMEPSERRKVAGLGAEYTTQDGNTGTIADLLDRPAAITFFYTRCENPHKCSAAVAAMAKLQEAVKKAGLAGKVRLIMISWEPQYDTPGRLRNYASGRRVEFNHEAHMLRLEQKALGELTEALNVPVNYNGGWVNIHGIGLFLLDRERRLARTYHTVIWDNERVLKDLKTLVDESQD